MLISIIGLAVLLLLATSGYNRGLLRILSVFIAFLLATFLAEPLSPLLIGPLKLSGLVAKALVPFAGQVLTGFLIFLLLSYVAGRILDHRDEVREQLNEHPIMVWERWSGAVIGFVWGVCLVVFSLTGLHVVGVVEEILINPAASAKTASGVTESESRDVRDIEGAQQELVQVAKFGHLKEQIENSAFGSLVLKAEPIDQRIKVIFQNLTWVVSQPELFEAFKNHTIIANFIDNPRMIALAKDHVIQAHLQNKQYYQLLDNEKIADLLKDKELYRELQEVEIGQILQEIIAKEEAH